MANKPTPADFSPTVPDFPVIGQYQPVYGKFDLTTYIQGASDYEIMAFLVQCYNATLKGYSDVTQLSKDTVTAYNQLQTWVNTWFAELDVQQEINNKLQSMYEAGTLANVIAQSNAIPPAVAQYLNSEQGTQNLSNVTAAKIDSMAQDGSLATVVAQTNKIPEAVKQYLDSVDGTKNLSDVTAQKIEEMAASGALGTVITNTGTVQSTTTDWLQHNVTPTGSVVMVDKSMSISGAAADAQVVGTDYYGNKKITAKTDLNELLQVGIYVADEDSRNLVNSPYPSGTRFILMVSKISTSYYQTAIPFAYRIGILSTYKMYTRLITSNSVENWYCVKGSENNSLKADTDLNDLRDNGVYVSIANSTGLLNSPYDSLKYFILVCAKHAFGTAQIILPFSANSAAYDSHMIWTRNVASSTSTDWVREGFYTTEIPANADLNDYLNEGLYTSSKASTNLRNSPYSDTRTFVLEVAKSSGGVFQTIRPFMTGNENLDTYYAYTRTVSKSSASQWKRVFKDKINEYKDKTWIVLGDSRSAPTFSPGSGKHYYDFISSETGLNVKSYAVAGNRLIHIVIELGRVTESPDIISVMAGINDWGQTNPTPLGTIEDTANTTVYGAIDYIIKEVYKKFPSVTLFFITPAPCSENVNITDWAGKGLQPNSLGYTILDVNKAIFEVCKKYGVQVVNDGEMGGYTPLIAEENDKYFIDGLHMNVAGQKKCANYIYKNFPKLTFK